MSLFVNTNVSSLEAQRQLFTAANRLDTSFQQLSSGFRINSAKDDAAGQQISDRMTVQVNGLNQAVRNANDGISLAQTAEGSMSEITTALQRIRVLAIQAQSGINSLEDRAALEKEVVALQAEIDRVAETTQFGGVDVLRGDFASSFLIGANSGQYLEVNLQRPGGFTADSIFAGQLVSILTEEDAAQALDIIDAAIQTIDDKRAELGALQSRFQSSIRNLSTVAENASAARSRIRDTDYAAATSELTRWQITQEASVSVLGQANQRTQQALQLLQ